MQDAGKAARGRCFFRGIEMEEYRAIFSKLTCQVKRRLAFVHPFHPFKGGKVLRQWRYLTGVLEEQWQAELTGCAAECRGYFLQLGWHGHGRNDKPRNIWPVLSLCTMSQPSESLEIVPGAVPSATIAVPGSKSVSNRALVIAAVAAGTSQLHGLLAAEDTEVMILALRQLGVSISQTDQVTTVAGHGGPLPSAGADLDAGLSGTTVRFLLPLVAAGSGRFRVTGRGSMLLRPVGDQLATLQGLGVNAWSEQGNGCPPVNIETSGLHGGEVTVSGDLSSQYLSGLLMAAPLARQPVKITVTGELQSKPFVDITLDVMRRFGVEVMRDGYASFTVEPGRYTAAELQIEGDATAAGNFWVAAAITGSTVTVSNVGSDSSQGDRALADVLGRMGCQVTWTAESCTVSGPPRGQLRGGDFDLNDIPDQALALAVAGLFTDGPLTIRNVANMRIKETDRLAAVATELRRLGAVVTDGPDWITVEPQAAYRPAEIRTYDDHRMAMAFALAGLNLPGVTILDPGCVAKTYPGYWQDFAQLQVEQ